MKRTVMAIVEVEDSVNNGQVLDTLENKFIIDRNVCSLRDAVVLDEDGEYEHERYLNYLMNWIVDHHDDEFAGQSPVGFDEWLENEDIYYENIKEDNAMTDGRKEELLNEILDWASEMYNGFELYEWARNRGMTEKEMNQTFCCFNDEELNEYRKRYSEYYD